MCAVTRLQRKQHCCDLNWARGSEGLAWPRATCPHPSSCEWAAGSSSEPGVGRNGHWAGLRDCCWSRVLLPPARLEMSVLNLSSAFVKLYFDVSPLFLWEGWCHLAHPCLPCDYVVGFPFVIKSQVLWLSNKLSFCIFPGGGGVWAPGTGNVSVEPAGGPSAFHGVLARLICSSDLFLFQYSGPACLQRAAPLPLLDQVIQEPADRWISVWTVFWSEYLCSFRDEIWILALLPLDTKQIFVLIAVTKHMNPVKLFLYRQGFHSEQTLI